MYQVIVRMVDGHLSIVLTTDDWEVAKATAEQYRGMVRVADAFIRRKRPGE